MLLVTIPIWANSYHPECHHICKHITAEGKSATVFLVSCNILDLARQDEVFRFCHVIPSSVCGVLLQAITWLISTFIYFSLLGLRRMRE